MAAITLLGSIFDTNSGTHTVTATPAVGDLIVIVTMASGNTSAATCTDNNSSGAYATVTTAKKLTNVDTMTIQVRTTLIAAASSTIFTHAPGTSTGGGIAVYKVTGMNKLGAAAAVQSAIQENIASGTPAPVMGAAVNTQNPVITAVMNGTNVSGLTARTSPAYTRDTNLGYNTPSNGMCTTHVDSGETGTTLTWGSSSASAFCSIAVELDITALINKSDSTAVTATPTIFIPTLVIDASDFTESTAVSDTSTIVEADTISKTDSTAVSDTPTLEIISLISVSDSSAVTDLPFYYDDSPIVWEPVISLRLVNSISVSESTAVSDVPTIEVINFISNTDSTSVTETPTVQILDAINTSDSSAVSDTPTLEIFSFINISESTAVTDTPTVRLTSNLNVSDSSVVSDTPTVEIISFISKTESIVLSDSPTLELFSFVSVTESTSVSDTATIEDIEQGVVVSDSTTVSDAPLIKVVSFVSSAESTVVSDTPVIEQIAFISVSDSTAITDSATALPIGLTLFLSVSDSTRAYENFLNGVVFADGDGVTLTAPRPLNFATNVAGAYVTMIRIDSVPSVDKKIFSPGTDSLDLWVEGVTGKLYLKFKDSSGTTTIIAKTSVSVVDRAWHKIVVNKKAANVNLMVDGVQIGIVATSLPTFADASSTQWNPDGFSVSVGETSIYSRAFTSPEILAIINNGLYPVSGYAAWWLFYEFNTTSISDITGNGFTATLSTSETFVQINYPSNLGVVIPTLPLSTIDSINVSDTPSINILTSISISDSTVMTDVPISEIISSINVSDIASVSDIPSINLETYIFVLDSTIVSDNSNQVILLTILTEELISVSDIPALLFATVVSSSDSTAVSESVSLRVAIPPTFRNNIVELGWHASQYEIRAGWRQSSYVVTLDFSQTMYTVQLGWRKSGYIVETGIDQSGYGVQILP